MKSRSGFTLLEILVVVMIITILASIVGVFVADVPGKGRIARAQAEIAAFRTALQRYRMDHSRLPTQEQGLSALCTVPGRPPVPANYPAHGYLDRPTLPPDPWGNDYVYIVPGPRGEPFEIITYGADGEPGGEGEDADISSSAQ